MTEENKESEHHTSAHEHPEHHEHTENHEHAAHEHTHHEAPAETHKEVAAPVKAAKKSHSKKKKAKAHEAHHAEHEAKAHPKKFKYWNFVIGGAIVLVIIIALIIRFSSGPSVTDVADAEKYGNVKVDFYVMSQCPYGTQVEDAFQPVMAEFSKNVDFELNFIAGETDGGFQSLHGAAEVAGDIVQLCVQKYAPEKLLDFVVCQNKDAKDLVSSIDSCAEDAGIDASNIKSCKDGAEGKALMVESIGKSNAVGASGSPTIYINDKAYNSARDSTSFKRAVCAGLDSHPLCADIPVCSADAECVGEPGKIGVCANAGKKDAECSYQDDALVTLTVLTSADCPTCNPTELVNALRQAFINMEVKVVDVADKEGKELITKYSLEKAPSFVFENVDESYAWKNNPNIPPAFEQVDEMYVLRDEVTGAKYLIDAEKRAEMEAKIGVKTGDNKPQIDFYVMSYCPYGNMAEEAIEPVYKLLGSKAEFNPHYVIYSNYQGGGAKYCLDAESKYCSMHGVQEVTQDVREICVHNYFGDKAYFEFVLAMNAKCSAANADACWEAVAKSVGLDSAKIKACEKDEALTLLANELELDGILGVQGSPTVFVEGQAFNGARTAQGYGAALCAGFDTAPAECGKVSTLAGASSATTATGGCG